MSNDLEYSIPLRTDASSRAQRFDVTLQFLSQQAAWLYERQLAQVRAQLRKVNRPSSTGTSPTPGSASGSGTVTGGHPMSRGGSAGILLPKLVGFQGLTAYKAPELLPLFRIDPSLVHLRMTKSVGLRHDW